MLYHFPIFVTIHQRKFQTAFEGKKNKRLNGPVPVIQATVLTFFVTLQMFMRICMYQQNVILCFRKKNRGIYTLRWSILLFGSEFCINLKNGIRFQKRRQIFNRKKEKGPYLSCSCNHRWVMYCDYNFFFNWQASGTLRELVTRWWISFSILAGWSNKPKADIDICHSTLEPYRLLCWLVKYFTSL